MIEYLSYSLEVMGIILIVWSLICLIRVKKQDSYGVELEAIVVELHQNKVRTGKAVFDEFTPILEYTIADGIYHAEGPTVQVGTHYQLGQTVLIRCKPEKPEKIVAVGDRSGLFNLVLIGICGLLMEILSFLL